MLPCTRTDEGQMDTLVAASNDVVVPEAIEDESKEQDGTLSNQHEADLVVVDETGRLPPVADEDTQASRDRGEDDRLVVTRVGDEHPESIPRRQRRIIISNSNPIRILIKDRLLPLVLTGLGHFESWTEQFLNEAETIENEVTGSTFWRIVIQYNLVSIAFVMLGLLLVFCGRHFLITFTILEAFRHGDSEALQKNLSLLKRQVDSIYEANKKDDLEDEDGNGVPDVKELSAKALARRKVRLIIRTIQPSTVQNALQGLWISLVSASAAVKVQAARQVTLGMSLGNDINRWGQSFLVPFLVVMGADERARTWWSPAVLYSCRFVGIILAFVLPQTIPLVTTATRGSFLVVLGLTDFCESQGLGYFPRDATQSFWIAGGLAATGLLYQTMVVDYYSIPFVLQVIVLPITWLEGFVGYIVSLLRSDAERFQKAIGNGPGLTGPV